MEWSSEWSFGMTSPCHMVEYGHLPCCSASCKSPGFWRIGSGQNASLRAGAVHTDCPGRLQGSPLWRAGGYIPHLILMQRKPSVMERLKALELLERKGFLMHLWNKGMRCCGVLMCNSDLPAYDDVITVLLGLSVLAVLGHGSVGLMLAACGDVLFSVL